MRWMCKLFGHHIQESRKANAVYPRIFWVEKTILNQLGGGFYVVWAKCDRCNTWFVIGEVPVDRGQVRTYNNDPVIRKYQP